jgi:hypothetical protein
MSTNVKKALTLTKASYETKKKMHIKIFDLEMWEAS